MNNNYRRHDEIPNTRTFALISPRERHERTGWHVRRATRVNAADFLL